MMNLSCYLIGRENQNGHVCPPPPQPDTSFTLLHLSTLPVFFTLPYPQGSIRYHYKNIVFLFSPKSRKLYVQEFVDEK